MRKLNYSLLIKCIVFGVICSLILVIIGLFIKNYANSNFKDILFLEGIIVVILSTMASVGGNSFGLSMGALGQMNSQYVANVNLEAHKVEKEKTKGNITTLNFGLISTSMIIGGLICIIGSFIIPI